MAHAAGLPVYDKPDSTGICFIGERPFRGILEPLSAYRARTDRGLTDGRVLGEHRGLALYTLGQSSGLEASAARRNRGRTLVRRGQSHGSQRAHRGPGSGSSLLLSDSFDVEEMHWLDPGDAGAEIECAVKTRYRQNDLEPAWCVRAAMTAGGSNWSAPRARSHPANTPCSTGRALSRRRRHREALQFRAAPAAGGITYNSLFSVEGS